MNIFCILVHVPDRNTKNRWFVASAPRIFRLFTNLSSGLLVNLSRPRCISNYRERGEFRFCKLFETHTWCTCYTNFIRPAFLKFSWLPPALVFHVHLHILIFLHPPFSLYHAIYFSPKYIYIFLFSLPYYGTFISNLFMSIDSNTSVQNPRSNRFPSLFFKKLKNSNLEWFPPRSNSSSNSRRS